MPKDSQPDPKEVRKAKANGQTPLILLAMCQSFLKVSKNSINCFEHEKSISRLNC